MLCDGFTRRYLIDRLVYYETTNDVEAAIRREKEIKSWVRRKKIYLIESVNPEWKDLSEDL
jgi:putative endonuclease